MEIEIEQKSEEPLLGRTRIEGSLSFESATPSKSDVIKYIAGKLKVNENAVALRHIYTDFGAKSARVIAYTYKDDALKLKIEQKRKGSKGKPKDKSKESEPMQE